MEDSPVLTEISQRAFDSDIRCGSEERGGPPGYDNVEWQTRMITNPGATYYKILLGERIIGGALVYPLRQEGDYCLGRIYIAPSHHRQGLGRQAMHLVERAFPDARRWVLDTPAWNTRTRQFYREVGYELVEEGEFLVFEKMVRAWV